MARWVVSCGLWLCSAVALAQAPVKKVAILELKATGIDETVAKNLGELFTAEAGRVPGYKVIGNTEIMDMVGFEIQKQTLGCSEASCFAEIGGALGVDLIVSGTIGKVGETFVVNLRFIDIKKNETMNRIGESIAGRVEILPDYVRVAAWRLFQQPVPQDVLAAFDATKARLEKAGAPVPAPTPTTPPPQIVQTQHQETAPQPAAVHQAPPPPAPTENWATIPKSICKAVAAVGIVGGAGLHGFSYWKASQLKGETTKVDGEDVYVGTQAEAVSAMNYFNWAKTGYIVGGVGVVGAIVFSILEPSPQTMGGLQISPTPNGLAVSF